MYPSDDRHHLHHPSTATADRKRKGKEVVVGGEERQIRPRVLLDSTFRGEERQSRPRVLPESTFGGVSQSIESLGLGDRFRFSRGATAQIRPRSVSQTPGICNFYAQGWCIKGNACRFLHLDSTRIPDRDPGYANKKSELWAGWGAGTEVSGQPGFPDAAVSSCPSSLNISSSGSLYHPIHGSIQQPNIGDQFSQFSSSQGTSTLSSHLPLNGSHVVTEKVGTFVAEQHKGLTIYEDAQEKRKALKRFRDDLINYVKELMKPTWEAGLLSKAAHNFIVKKAVDKIVNAEEKCRFPSTVEAVNEYFRLSGHKIEKLVEGYIQKHGRV